MEINILVEEQTGFRLQHFILDYCFDLYHLITKQNKTLLQKLNTYFALNSLNISKTKSKVVAFSIKSVKYN
ncbi:hypothetical protein E2320_002160, partial [Naja naja]